MGRPKKNPESAVVNGVAVDEPTATPIAVTGDSELKKNTTKNIRASLRDDEEIEIMSIYPNVSYYDSKTGDTYKWERAGDIEVMDVATIKNLWRNHKGYFRNLYLKPLDERIIKLFALESTYKKYEFLTNPENYVRKNRDMICNTLDELSMPIKWSISGAIKAMVTDGEITDALVIKAVEKKLDIDLMELLAD